MMNRRTLVFPTWLLAPALTCTLSVTPGCSSDEDDGAFSSGSTGSDVAGTAAAGTGLGLSTASSGASGTGTGSSGTGGGFETCAGVQSEGEPLGLDMFIVLDHTTSMQNGAGQDGGGQQGGGDCPLDVTGTPSVANKWCYATHALGQFFVSGAAAGHRAALQFMALPGYACDGVNNAQGQAAVPLTLLPVDVGSPLIQALDDDQPDGGGLPTDQGGTTAIEAALRGITEFTLQNRSPARKMIGILITDGNPTLCTTDDDAVLAGIIQDHLAATGIETYIIGMTGASEDRLQTMAVAGGAPEHGPEFCGGMSTCNFYSVGDGDPAAFVDAMAAIQRAAVLPCTYGIPNPPAGESIDPDLVNVELSSPQGMTSELYRVNSLAECDPANGGWYYDNLAGPTTLELCPTTCDAAVALGEGARVQISYGCRVRVEIE